MWRLNKEKFLFIFLFPLFSFAQSEQCTLKLKGIVSDLHAQTSLESVNVYLIETGTGIISDDQGFFEISGLCPGDYHMIFSHVGCHPVETFLKLKKDTLIQVSMDHSGHELEGVLIEAESIKSTQDVKGLRDQDIADNSDENLASMLEGISGVSVIRNGSGIAKPVVHGLSGNRLTIMNNGVTQSGQRWGSDHSPEIDPLTANSIQVVKGVSSIAYMGSNLGAVILVEPGKIRQEPHLHGRAGYFFESNGLSNGINLQLQQYNPGISWKVNGSSKKSGDRKSADYFLNNTGIEEANGSLQLERTISDSTFLSLYFSTFNAEIGILRGSHIGNLTDLQSAFVREEPFFTEDEFSYNIEAPRQKVNHHLLKLNAKHYMRGDRWIEGTVAGQLNLRREFDVRRGGRTDTPTLDLEQYTLYSEIKYHQDISDLYSLEIGIQFNLTQNTNNPETGILPLIPDYYQYETGAFAILRREKERSQLELGIRYDNVIQDAITISRGIPREIVRFDNVYNIVGGSVGWNYFISEDIKWASNIGYSGRNPGINELYSSGLHQGVSGIEQGDPDLKTETAAKASSSIAAKISKRFSIESLFYYQYINDFIYLAPSNEIRLTIRGAFPVFNYEQSDSEIYGLDLSSQYELSESLSIHLTYAYLRGWDIDNQIPLVFMPANNLRSTLGYKFPKNIEIGNRKVENLEFALQYFYVFEQSNILDDQDFLLPPAAYGLLRINTSFDIQLKKTRLRTWVKVDNVLNESYRDYLNRLRYFADDLGINASLGVSLKF